MIIKSSDNQWFKAGDHTTLKEVLHPAAANLPLPFSLAHAFLNEGETSLLHSLAQTEIYFITHGSGEIFHSDQWCPIEKGDTVVVPPAMPQSVKNTGKGPLEFLCIVAPAWTAEGEIILK